MAVVEAMAAGLVPVVHRSRGPWHDIIDHGRFGLGYTTLEEAIETVEKALREYRSLSIRVIERAQVFTPENFRKRLTEIIRATIRNNHLRSI